MPHAQLLAGLARRPVSRATGKLHTYLQSDSQPTQDNGHATKLIQDARETALACQ